MEFKNTYEMSYFDKNRGLTIPKKMTSELAEYLGIIVGDGYVGKITNRKTGKTSHVVEISGNMKNDIEYHERIIIPLYKRIFNVDTNLSHRPKDNTIRVVFYSKGLVGFLNELGIISPKHNIEIPSCVLNRKKVWPDFIRGLFDTDGSLSLKKRYRNYHYYPVISLRQKSRNIIEQVVRMLKEFGFVMSVQYNDTLVDKRGFISTGSRLYINGVKNLELWTDIIGFSNPKNLIKTKKCFEFMGREGFEPSTPST